MLESSIDVGTYFLDVEPDDQLLFYYHPEGHLFTQFKLINPVEHCPVAFFIQTSAKIPIQIHPNMGFVSHIEKEK